MSIGASVVSSRSCARRTRSRISHSIGAVPVAARKRRVKVRTLIAARSASASMVIAFAQIARHPVGDARDAVIGAHRDRLHDELRLAAVAMRRHHHAAREHVGDLRPVVLAHQMQQQVDAGGRSGRGHHVAFVDIEHVGLDPDRGKQPREPSRCGASAWWRGGRRAGPHGRAGTRRSRSRRRARRAPRPRAAPAVISGRGRLVEIAPARHHDQVRVAQQLQPPSTSTRMPPSPRSGGGSAAATANRYGTKSSSGPRQREELGRDAELEHREPVRRERDDEGRGARHGRILPDFGIPANSGLAATCVPRCATLMHRTQEITMPTLVTEPGFADPAAALAHFERRLGVETDCSDVHEWLARARTSCWSTCAAQSSTPPATCRAPSTSRTGP